MLHVILFEDSRVSSFYPLALTRPVGELRIGILTIREKWEKALGHPVHHETRAHLHELFAPFSGKGPAYRINARLIPTASVVAQIQSLGEGEKLMDSDMLLAERTGASEVVHQVHAAPLLLHHITDVFSRNGDAIRMDFEAVTRGRASHAPGEGVTVLGPAENLFVEEGAKLRGSMINVEEGPVYIGRHAEIMEGCMIRGPLALCEYAVIKMGAKIYGPTTFGPECRVGGEVSNSVIQGYSNKGHDGFLGNSVLGEWCNLGADTNTSNLKNNYSAVRVWNYETSRMEDSGLTFVGLIMGDHGKSGINTMFNTGTVAGVAANVFGGGFPPKYIPSFSWGGPEGMTTYRLEDALITADRMMSRRHVALTDAMRQMLTEVARMAQTEGI